MIITQMIFMRLKWSLVTVKFNGQWTMSIHVKINGGLSNGPNVKFNELSDDYSLLKSMHGYACTVKINDAAGHC